MSNQVTAPQNELQDSVKNLTISSTNTNTTMNNIQRTTATDSSGTADVPTEDSQRSNKLSQQDRKDLRSDTINYDAQRMIGHGSFGAVFLAKVVETDEMVAIKKVLQDKRFKNRELEIMRQLAKQPHPFVVLLKHHFVSKGSKSDDVYLNLVLEYIPETIYSVSKYFNRRKESMPIFSVKLYMYQLSRALAHIHGMGICHRDIKPHNLLVDPVRQVLKLCDFGSAKAFIKGEPNVAYICSRFYRAPELIFGATDYNVAIDVWSQGCVFAELLIGSPIFPGSSGIDQLVEIIKVLGTPTKEELKSMNPNYQEFRFPQIRAHPWGSIFKPSTPQDAIDLIGRMLAYVPDKRFRAIEACLHPFFAELKQANSTMPDGSPLPEDMFNFTQEEVALVPGILSALIPVHLQGKSTLYQLRLHGDRPSEQQPVNTATAPPAAPPISPPVSSSTAQPAVDKVNPTDAASAATVTDNVVGTTSAAVTTSEA